MWLLSQKQLAKYYTTDQPMMKVNPHRLGFVGGSLFCQKAKMLQKKISYLGITNTLSTKQTKTIDLK
jgi:hypothetical protein